MKHTLGFVIILIISAISIQLSAQKYEGGIPFLRNYSHEEYKGENQNFAIVQDDRGLMYFANNTSILEFDGQNWRQIFIPNKSIVYSLGKDENGRIYVGASKGELGYLEANARGILEYYSLKDILPPEHADFNYIREISFPKNGNILFISSLKIFIFDGKKFTVRKTSEKSEAYNRFVSGFDLQGRTFIQERGLGLLEYTENDKFKLLPGTEHFSGIWISGIFLTDSDSLMFTTWYDKVYMYHKGEMTSKEPNPLLRNIYKNVQYNDDTYILGLYDGGIVFADKYLNIKKHIYSGTGLQNNNIYSLHIDQSGNVWAGLSNGISVIHAHSSFSVYDNNFGLSSTTLAAKHFEGKLYIGNSTGVYYMDWNNRSPLSNQKFKEVENVGSFQIWHIDSIDNKLFCSGSSGIFTIENGKAKFIQTDESIKSFIQLKYRPDIILGIGGNGLSKISKEKGKWAKYERIKGFNEDFKYITQAGRNDFWVSDRNKGLIRLQLSNELDSVVSVREYNIKDGLPDKLGNQMFRYNNQLIFATEKGIYNYDEENAIFIPNEYFDELLGKNAAITDFIQDKEGNVWFKQKFDDPKIPNKSNWELGYIEQTADSAIIHKTPFLKLRNNIHTIYPLPDNEILIGTEKGFVIHAQNHKELIFKDFDALIRRVEIIKNDSVIFGGAHSDTTGIPHRKQDPEKIPVLPFEFRDVRIMFSSVFFEEPERTKYKYILEGNDKDWSDWKNETMKDYSNLEPGNYKFRVKAMNLYRHESTEAVFEFVIKPPYYRTVWAYVIYVILFGLFIWAVIAFSTRRVKKQKENLERIVEERTRQIKAQNVELNKRNEEIRRKNKDITASINYAKRIQDAMLPMQSEITSAFGDSFILFKPRDIVSGDFYWFAQKSGKIIITAVDCTGHGVPGAFMSLIGSEILASVVGQNILNASDILEKMNRYVVAALKQEETANQDGMDMALCVIDPEKKQLDFAGAKNPLVFIRNDDVTYIKASRKGIGGHQEAGAFDMETIHYKSPTYFYIFTDGYQDQFGGPKNRKFMIKRLRDLLSDIHKLPGAEQKKILNDTIEDWMKGHEQTDDILLMGFKL